MSLVKSMMMCVFGAGVALYPGACAIGIVFFLPDRDSGFDRVDDGAAGGECGIAVCGGDSDSDGDVTNLKVSGAVLASGADDIVFAANLLKDAIAFFFGECWKSFVF